MTHVLTKTERIARQKLFRQLWEAQDDALDDAIRAEVPDAWHTLEDDVDVTERKVKVTLYLDASVAQVYKAMGVGYQARINRVLSTWVQMKMAGLLRRRDHVGKRFDSLMALEHAADEAGVPTAGFGVALKK